MKVAINRCFGGYSLSQKALERLVELGVPCVDYEEQTRDPKTGLYEKERDHGHGDKVIYKGGSVGASLRGGDLWEVWVRGDEYRTDPLVIQVIEELGKEANGMCADLAIVDVPDGTNFEISEYDGLEHIAESHRTWS